PRPRAVVRRSRDRAARGQPGLARPARGAGLGHGRQRRGRARAPAPGALMAGYDPPRDAWQARPPDALGLRPDGLAAAIDYHRAALDDGFESPQNRPITWRHLLQQTSEWEGTLWGKPDSIDHYRDVGRSELGGGDKGPARALRPPGTYWEYNDVRVNRLSLSLLQLFRRPLAEVLRRAVMDLIGAAEGWQWQPYRNSYVGLDGERMPSVPGGSHWGGGLWISTRGQARFGLLIHRGGRWQGREVLAESWTEE